MNIKNTQHIDTADGTRAIACLIVLILHATVLSFPETTKYLAGMPKFGVWLFFVLSAFLLTNKFIATGFTRKSISFYVLGRILRIVPLYILAIVIYTVFQAGGFSNWGQAKDAILLKTGYVHFWTIPVEFIYYALLPIFSFLFVKAAERVTGIALILLLGSLILLHQLIWPYYDTPVGTIAFTWYIPCFLIGTYLAVALPGIQLPKNFLTDNLPLIVVVVFVLAAPGIRYFFFGMPAEKTLVNKFLFVSIGWAIFIIAVNKMNSIYSRFLKNKVLVRIGKQSYSIYLFHWIVFEKVFSNYSGNLVATIIAILLALAAGAVSYRLVEVPIETIRRKIENRINRNNTPSEKMEKFQTL